MGSRKSPKAERLFGTLPENGIRLLLQVPGPIYPLRTLTLSIPGEDENHLVLVTTTQASLTNEAKGQIAQDLGLSKKALKRAVINDPAYTSIVEEALELDSGIIVIPESPFVLKL
ncbi:MAG: hypothetical protein KDD60_06945 [Bdellovibrionales bacterium]|nr:hypothetical protein [Bdellovibrionales bacterium]